MWQQLCLKQLKIRLKKSNVDLLSQQPEVRGHILQYWFHDLFKPFICICRVEILFHVKKRPLTSEMRIWVRKFCFPLKHANQGHIIFILAGEIFFFFLSLISLHISFLTSCFVDLRQYYLMTWCHVSFTSRYCYFQWN